MKKTIISDLQKKIDYNLRTALKKEIVVTEQESSY